MTDKEKVLKVWPDTIVYGNKILWKWLWYRESDPDKISGKFDTEEAAWQNAAESLPAQQKRCKCGHDATEHKYSSTMRRLVCLHLSGPEAYCPCDAFESLENEHSEPVKVEGKHRFMAGTCVDCGQPLAETCIPLPSFEPVAPVGAKEKAAQHVFQPDTKYDCMVCDEPINALIHIPADEGSDNKSLCPCTASGQCAGVSSSLACRSDLKIAFAEPKPTPSTGLKAECNEQEFNGVLPPECPKCGEPIWGEGWNPVTGVRYFSHIPQPQPDSGPTSAEPVAAEGKLDGFPFQIRKDIPESEVHAGTKSGAYLMLKFAGRDSSSISHVPSVGELSYDGQSFIFLQGERGPTIFAEMRGYGAGLSMDANAEKLCKLWNSDELTLTRLRAAQLQERLDAVELKYAELVSLHASLIDLIDKTQSCTSGLSVGECLDEIKMRLGE